MAQPRLAAAGPGGEDFTVTCRWPAGAVPKALVIFCHGLGAGRTDYADLSRKLAAHGYLVVHPDFPDGAVALAEAEPELGFGPGDPALLHWTTVPVLRQRLYDMLHTPHNWLERIRIVHAVMDAMDMVFAASCGLPAAPVPCAIVGHSFGAYTAQLFAGAEIDVPGQGPRRFKDARFRAAILLSAQGRDQQGLRDGSWDDMTGPVLTVTGTRDGGAKGQDFHWKMEPFDLGPPGDKMLAVFDGADHYLGGMTDNDPTPGNSNQKAAVSDLTLAFLDAHVMGAPGARLWLGGLTDRIGACDVLIKRK